MGIRGLDGESPFSFPQDVNSGTDGDRTDVLDWINSRRLSTTAPLSALSGVRLGIDAKHYIEDLLSNPNSKEPYVQAIGGNNLSIPQRIENDMVTFNRHKITPIFIFTGIPTQINGPPRTFTEQDGRDVETRENAWNLYEEGKEAEAVALFSAIRGGSNEWRDCFRSVLRILKSRMIEYIFCPYLEHSQVSQDLFKR